jgi:folate-dependent phosphoribosylglycinamide formyltransferase PurN
LNITIFTSVSQNFISTYQIEQIKKNFENITIVAVDTNSIFFKFNRYLNLCKRINKKGIKWFLKLVLDKKKLAQCSKDWNDNLKIFSIDYPEILNQKDVKYDFIVTSINGYRTEEIIKKTNPDLLIQCGAGILKSNIFKIPKLYTLNVHGAIAPELRGGNSIFWAYFYGKPEWLGVTVHVIDEGIDTGPVLKRKTLLFEPGIHPAKKMIESCLLGASMLVETINDLQNQRIEPFNINIKGKYCGFYHSIDYNELKSNNWNPVRSI